MSACNNCNIHLPRGSSGDIDIFSFNFFSLKIISPICFRSTKATTDSDMGELIV